MTTKYNRAVTTTDLRPGPAVYIGGVSVIGDAPMTCPFCSGAVRRDWAYYSGRRLRLALVCDVCDRQAETVVEIMPPPRPRRSSIPGLPTVEELMAYEAHGERAEARTT